MNRGPFLQIQHGFSVRAMTLLLDEMLADPLELQLIHIFGFILSTSLSCCFFTLFVVRIWDIMYSTHSILYSVHSILYSAHSILYSAHCTQYFVQCTGRIIYSYTLYSEAVNTEYTIQYIIHCTQCLHYIMYIKECTPLILRPFFLFSLPYLLPFLIKVRGVQTFQFWKHDFDLWVGVMA